MEKRLKDMHVLFVIFVFKHCCIMRGIVFEGFTLARNLCWGDLWQDKMLSIELRKM